MNDLSCQPLTRRVSNKLRAQLLASGIGVFLTLFFSLCNQYAKAESVQKCARIEACNKILRMAQKFYEEEAYLQALKLYDQAYAMVPDPDIQIPRGICLFQLDKCREALSSFRIAQERTDNLPEEQKKVLESYIRTTQECISPAHPEPPTPSPSQRHSSPQLTVNRTGPLEKKPQVVGVTERVGTQTTSSGGTAALHPVGSATQQPTASRSAVENLPSGGPAKPPLIAPIDPKPRPTTTSRPEFLASHPTERPAAPESSPRLEQKPPTITGPAQDSIDPAVPVYKKPWFKGLLSGLGITVVLTAAGIGGYVGAQAASQRIEVVDVPLN